MLQQLALFMHTIETINEASEIITSFVHIYHQSNSEIFGFGCVYTDPAGTVPYRTDWNCSELLPLYPVKACFSLNRNSLSIIVFH